MLSETDAMSRLRVDERARRGFRAAALDRGRLGIRLETDELEVLAAQLAEEVGDAVRVVSGVQVGEKIVTEGSFFLRAEWERRGQSHIR